MFPTWAVGSVVGFGGIAGALGGILVQIPAGRIKDLTGSYLTMFIIACAVYLLALLISTACPPAYPGALGVRGPQGAATR